MPQPTSLIHDYDFSGVANTAAVAAGGHLLPGLLDVVGGIWSVNGGKLIGTKGGTDYGAALLLFDSFTGLTDQKMVVTMGAAGQYLMPLLRTRTGATPTGYYVQLTGSGFVSAGQALPSASTDFGGTSTAGYAGADRYQLVVQLLNTGVSGVNGSDGNAHFQIGIFDLANPALGQPADPQNITDTGNICTLTTTKDYRAAGSQLLSGGFGLTTNSASVSISRVRLYGAPLVLQPDFGDHVMTGPLSRGQRLIVQGDGFTVGSAGVPGTVNSNGNISAAPVLAGPGLPAFGLSFSAANGDNGSPTAAHTQRVIDSSHAYLWLDVGTAAGTITVTNPVTGQTATIPVNANRPANVTRGVGWTGEVTARTFDGANSVKFDGSDEVFTVQRLFDYAVRFSAGIVWDDDTVQVSRKIRLRDPQRYPGENPLAYIRGFHLHGIRRPSYCTRHRFRDTLDRRSAALRS